MAEYINCDLCGADETELVYIVSGMNIVKCLKCGLVYTNPRLTEVERDELYDSNYFTGCNTEKIDLVGCQDFFEMEQFHFADAQVRFREIMKYKNPPGRMLEIGCATGVFLDVARQKGWKTQGIEISDFAAKYAREKRELEVFSGELENVLIEPLSLDVICMYHVLEHIPNPKEYCNKLYRLLKPGGLLVITVPDISSPGAQKMGENWDFLVPYTHLYHFSKESLGKLLAQCNYQVLSLALVGGSGLLRKSKGDSAFKTGFQVFLIKYFIYFRWLKRMINFVMPKLFQRYDTITIYAQK